MSLLGKKFYSLLEMSACCYDNKEYFYNTTRQGIHDPLIVHMKVVSTYFNPVYSRSRDRLALDA